MKKILGIFFGFIFYAFIGLIIALAVGICEFIRYYGECFVLWWNTFVEEE